MIEESAADDGTPGRLAAGALLTLGGVGYGCLLFVWFSLPAYLSPVIDDLGLTGLQAGVLAGAVPLTYIPLGLASGLLIDRIGARRGIAAGVVLAGVGQFGRAFAPEFWSMLALTLVLGVGATGLTFGLPKLAAELYPTDRVGRAATVYLIGSSAGSAAAFGLGRPLIGPALGGWRPLFVASGLTTLVVAVGWIVAARYVPAGRYETDDATFTRAALVADLRAVFSSHGLRLLVAVGTMYLLISHGIQGWLVTILEARGFDSGLAGTVTSLLVVAHVIALLVVPVVAERLERRSETLIVCPALAFVGLLALLVELPWTPLVVVPVALIGFGLGGLSPLIRAIPVELDDVGPALTGTAVGLVFAIGEIGGFLGPVFVGSLQDATGSFAPGIAVLALGAIVAAAAGAAMPDVDG